METLSSESSASKEGQKLKTNITCGTFAVRVEEDENISVGHCRTMLATTHNSSLLVQMYESNDRQQCHVVIKLLLEMN